MMHCLDVFEQKYVIVLMRVIVSFRLSKMFQRNVLVKKRKKRKEELTMFYRIITYMTSVALALRTVMSQPTKANVSTFF